VALRAGALEDDFALLLDGGERWIRIRQRCRPLPDRIRQLADTVIREEHALKGRQVVEELLRCDVPNLRMIGQRTERLLLKGPHTCVQLVSTEEVRTACPGIRAVWSGEGDVVDRRHHPPDVHERFGRRRVGRRIDEPHVRRQRERDPDESVLTKIAEVARVFAIGPEIIRINWPEQRVVGLWIESTEPLQQAEPRLSAGRRELELVRRHVAVGARAAVGVETSQSPIEERAKAADDRVAWFASAVEGLMLQLGAVAASVFRLSGVAGAHEEGGHQYEAADDEERSCSHGIPFRRDRLPIDPCHRRVKIRW
jgi:hypothetical protein